MNRLRAFLIVSQGSILILLSICSIILPSVVFDNAGVSNFGNNPSTVALYSLGFSLCVVFLWLAADNILQKSIRLKNLAYVIFLVGLLYFFVLVSTFPRHFSYDYSRVHDYLGVVLYFVEFLLSIWIIIKKHSILSISLFIIEAFGMGVGLLTSLKYFHLLYIGEIVGALGFAAILIIYLPPIIMIESKKTLER